MRERRRVAGAGSSGLLAALAILAILALGRRVVSRVVDAAARRVGLEAVEVVHRLVDQRHGQLGDVPAGHVLAGGRAPRDELAVRQGRRPEHGLHLPLGDAVGVVRAGDHQHVAVRAVRRHVRRRLRVGHHAVRVVPVIGELAVGACKRRVADRRHEVRHSAADRAGRHQGVPEAVLVSRVVGVLVGKRVVGADVELPAVRQPVHVRVELASRGRDEAERVLGEVLPAVGVRRSVRRVRARVHARGRRVEPEVRVHAVVDEGHVLLGERVARAEVGERLHGLLVRDERLGVVVEARRLDQVRRGAVLGDRHDVLVGAVGRHDRPHALRDRHRALRPGPVVRKRVEVVRHGRVVHRRNERLHLVRQRAVERLVVSRVVRIAVRERVGGADVELPAVRESVLVRVELARRGRDEAERVLREVLPAVGVGRRVRRVGARVHPRGRRVEAEVRVDAVVDERHVLLRERVARAEVGERLRGLPVRDERPGVVVEARRVDQVRRGAVLGDRHDVLVGAVGRHDRPHARGDRHRALRERPVVSQRVELREVRRVVDLLLERGHGLGQRAVRLRRVPEVVAVVRVVADLGRGRREDVGVRDAVLLRDVPEVQLVAVGERVAVRVRLPRGHLADQVARGLDLRQVVALGRHLPEARERNRVRALSEGRVALGVHRLGAGKRRRRVVAEEVVHRRVHHHDVRRDAPVEHAACVIEAVRVHVRGRLRHEREAHEVRRRVEDVVRRVHDVDVVALHRGRELAADERHHVVRRREGPERRLLLGRRVREAVRHREAVVVRRHQLGQRPVLKRTVVEVQVVRRVVPVLVRERVGGADVELPAVRQPVHVRVELASRGRDEAERVLGEVLPAVGVRRRVRRVGPRVHARGRRVEAEVRVDAVVDERHVLLRERVAGAEVGELTVGLPVGNERAGVVVEPRRLDEVRRRAVLGNGHHVVRAAVRRSRHDRPHARGDRHRALGERPVVRKRVELGEVGRVVDLLLERGHGLGQRAVGLRRVPEVELVVRVEDDVRGVGADRREIDVCRVNRERGVRVRSEPSLGVGVRECDIEFPAVREAVRVVVEAADRERRVEVDAERRQVVRRRHVLPVGRERHGVRAGDLRGRLVALPVGRSHRLGRHCRRVVEAEPVVHRRVDEHDAPLRERVRRDVGRGGPFVGRGRDKGLVRVGELEGPVGELAVDVEDVAHAVRLEDVCVDLGVCHVVVGTGEVGVNIERVCADGDFVAVRDAVAVGVGILRVGAEVVLLAVGEAVAVVVKRRVEAAGGRAGTALGLGEEVLEDIHLVILVPVGILQVDYGLGTGNCRDSARIKAGGVHAKLGIVAPSIVGFALVIGLASVRRILHVPSRDIVILVCLDGKRCRPDTSIKDCHFSGKRLTEVARLKRANHELAAGKRIRRRRVPHLDIDCACKRHAVIHLELASGRPTRVIRWHLRELVVAERYLVRDLHTTCEQEVRNGHRIYAALRRRQRRNVVSRPCSTTVLRHRKPVLCRTSRNKCHVVGDCRNLYRRRRAGNVQISDRTGRGEVRSERLARNGISRSEDVLSAEDDRVRRRVDRRRGNLEFLRILDEPLVEASREVGVAECRPILFADEVIAPNHTRRAGSSVDRSAHDPCACRLAIGVKHRIPNREELVRVAENNLGLDTIPSNYRICGAGYVGLVAIERHLEANLALLERTITPVAVAWVDPGVKSGLAARSIEPPRIKNRRAAAESYRRYRGHNSITVPRRLQILAMVGICGIDLIRPHDNAMRSIACIAKRQLYWRIGRSGEHKAVRHRCRVVLDSVGISIVTEPRSAPVVPAGFHRTRSRQGEFRHAQSVARGCLNELTAIKGKAEVVIRTTRNTEVVVRHTISLCFPDIKRHIIRILRGEELLVIGKSVEVIVLQEVAIADVILASLTVGVMILIIGALDGIGRLIVQEVFIPRIGHVHTLVESGNRVLEGITCKRELRRASPVRHRRKGDVQLPTIGQAVGIRVDHIGVGLPVDSE